MHSRGAGFCGCMLGWLPPCEGTDRLLSNLTLITQRGELKPGNMFTTCPVPNGNPQLNDFNELQRNQVGAYSSWPLPTRQVTKGKGGAVALQWPDSTSFPHPTPNPHCWILLLHKIWIFCSLKIWGAFSLNFQNIDHDNCFLMVPS